MNTTVIPAEPGWTVWITFSDGSGVDEVPVVAWAIDNLDLESDLEKSAIAEVAQPITLLGSLWDDCDWVIRSPDGRFMAPEWNGGLEEVGKRFDSWIAAKRKAVAVWKASKA